MLHSNYKQYKTPMLILVSLYTTLEGSYARILLFLYDCEKDEKLHRGLGYNELSKDMRPDDMREYWTKYGYDGVSKNDLGDDLKYLRNEGLISEKPEDSGYKRHLNVL